MRTRLAILACLTLGVSLAIGCGDSSAAGGSGAGGAPVDVEVNGCVRSEAEDMTGQAEVTLTWTNPHQKCVVVDAGTTIVWDGDFVAHPLSGGENPTEEAGPITSSDQSGATASVTFASGGDFPYFCGIHFGTMQGVIYVE